MPAKIFTVAAVLLTLAMPAAAPAKPPFAEPDSGPDPRGLTVEASGLARIDRPARLEERTIERASDAARPAAQVRALREARRRALALAKAAGMALGPVQAVTDRLPAFQSFSVGSRYCRTRKQARRRTPRPRCQVPFFAAASLRVTFSTLETSAVASTGRAITASASAFAPVRARRRTSSSIRTALERAQLVADPMALEGARRRAAGVAQAAGFRLGALVAVAEEPRQPYFADILSGVFGPGRFCGTIRSPRVPPKRRCFVPAKASSVLRVTFVAAG
jgi:hypothetical protein